MVCINNSPAFDLLQLTVVQHTSHVLIHLLQTDNENKGFLLGIYKHIKNTLLTPREGNLCVPEMQVKTQAITIQRNADEYRRS